MQQTLPQSHSMLTMMHNDFTTAQPHTTAHSLYRYNTSVGQADKTMHVAQNPPINDDMAYWIDQHFKDRWRAIVGVGQ